MFDTISHEVAASKFAAKDENNVEKCETLQNSISDALAADAYANVKPWMKADLAGTAEGKIDAPGNAGAGLDTIGLNKEGGKDSFLPQLNLFDSSEEKPSNTTIFNVDPIPEE